jgi:hypothetical protein
MGVLKCVSLVIVIGLLSFVSGVQAQELAQNIQAPATAPVLEPAPAAPVNVPVARENGTVVKPVAVPAQGATNIPPQQINHVAAHTATNVPTAMDTNVPLHKIDHVVIQADTNVPAQAATNVPAVHVAVTPAEEAVIIPEDEEFFVDTWRHPSFQVGTRFLQVKLQDKTRGEPFNGSFVGTITEITEEKDNSPDKFYLQARLPKTPCWIGVSYDHVRAQTMDDSNGDGIADSGGGDGSVDISGYIPYLQAAWDNKTRFTPFIQVGYAFYKSKFDTIPNWSNGGRKVMNLDSTTGFELAGGLGIRIYKNLSADVFIRQMNVDDITGEYLMDGHKQSDIIYTMSYTAYGAGLNCRF